MEEQRILSLHDIFKAKAKDIIYSDLDKNNQVEQIIKSQEEAINEALNILLGNLESDYTPSKGGGMTPTAYNIDCIKTVIKLIEEGNLET